MTIVSSLKFPLEVMKVSGLTRVTLAVSVSQFKRLNIPSRRLIEDLKWVTIALAAASGDVTLNLVAKCRRKCLA